MPLSSTISGANRPDGEFLIPLIDAIPPIKGKVGAPIFRPEAVVADKAYTWTSNIVSLGIRGISADMERLYHEVFAQLRVKPE